MFKELINIYKDIFKKMPIFKLFVALVLLKGVVFSAYAWNIRYMSELNDILGLVIIIVCGIIVFKSRKIK